jgi:hypothetical protein
MLRFLSVAILCAGCRSTMPLPPMDAGTDAPDDAMLDAGRDGDVIAPDGGCWAMAPNVTCDYVASSESHGTSPNGETVLRYEVTEARAQLCAGTWRIVRCGWTSTYDAADAATATSADAGCEETAFPGGLARIQCSTTLTYSEGGSWRWERSTSWNSVTIAQ